MPETEQRTPQSVKELIQDPRFGILDQEEQKRMLLRFEPRIERLGFEERQKFLNRFSLPDDNPSKLALRERTRLANATGRERFLIENPKRAAFSESFRPAAQAAGGISGAILATPADVVGGPVPTAVGGALGIAAGNEAANIADRLLGIPEAKGRSFSDIIRGGGESLRLGFEAEAGGQILGKGIQKGVQKLGPLFTNKQAELIPSLSPSQRRLAELSEKLDVPLSPVEVRQGKSLALVESILDKNILSASDIQKFRLGQLESLVKQREAILAKNPNSESLESLGARIQGEVDDVLKRMGDLKSRTMNDARDQLLSKLGSTESFEQVGSFAKSELVRRSQRASAIADRLFTEVGESVDPGTKIPVNNLQKRARELLEEQKSLSPSLQNQKVMAILNDLSAKKGTGNSQIDSLVENLGPDARKQVFDQLGVSDPAAGISFRQLQKTRSRLGELVAESDQAFALGQPGMKFQSSPEAGIFKQLRKAIGKDLEEFALSTGGSTKQALERANKFFKAQKEVFSNDDIRRFAKTDPEKLVSTFFKSNNVTEIRRVKDAVGKSGFLKMKSKFTNDLFETGSGDVFDPAILKKKINQIGQETLDQIYTKQEQQQLSSLIQKTETLSQVPLDNKFFRGLLRQHPEKVVDFIIQRKATGNLKEAKQVLSTKEFKNLKEAFIQRLLNEQSTNAQTGQFSPARFNTALSKFDDRVLEQMFTKQEVSELKNLALVARNTKGAEIIGGNPSGTGQQVFTILTLFSPTKGVPIALGAKGMAKLYTSAAGRRFFIKDIVLNQNQKMTTEQFSRLASIVGRENIVDSDKPSQELQTGEQIRDRLNR